MQREDRGAALATEGTGRGKRHEDVSEVREGKHRKNTV